MNTLLSTISLIFAVMFGINAYQLYVEFELVGASIVLLLISLLLVSLPIILYVKNKKENEKNKHVVPKRKRFI